jgi:putative ABC transport system permease protein
MLQNHFRIAWRSLRKQKVYSMIMIGGFSVGIAACLLIALYIRDELSYDRHYPNVERIYRLYTEYHYQGKIYPSAYFPAPLARVLEQDFPEVERAGHVNAVRLFGAGSNYIRRMGDVQNIYEEGFVYADQGIVDLLQIPVIRGDAKHVLDKPGTIVISERVAKKLFPFGDPVGEILFINNDENRPYTVSGVIEDFPQHCHLQHNFMISLVGDPLYPGEQTKSTSTNYFTYVLLRPGADAAQFENKLQEIKTNYLVAAYEKEGSFTKEQLEALMTFKIQPIRDVHLKLTDMRDTSNHGDIRFVWMFGAIGMIILLIACVNFINLSTARSANRAKEVGLRKVVGSSRSSLIRQFLSESLLFSFISFGLGIILMELFLPYFNQLTDKTLVFPWNVWEVFPLLLFSTTFIGIAAGVFPALYLSSFKPVSVLKGEISRRSRSGGLRGGLVIFQFSTCILLIVGTMIVNRQLDFVLHTKLGYEKEQVLLIQGTSILGDQVASFKDELTQLSGVKSASVGDYLPVEQGKRNGNTFWVEGESKTDTLGGQFWLVDTDYIRTFGMRLVEGRNFSREMPSDSRAAIINQQMVEQLGLTNPVGQQIINWKDPWTIIGVVEDFHYSSMRSEIRPVCMVLGNSPSMTAVKMDTADLPGLIASISGIWDAFSPNQPIRYTFLDESYAKMYADVLQMGKLLGNFSLLAILVACLGLYALSAFLTEQRSKEISIRRIVGASLSSIFGLLTLSYLRLVLVAFLIAAPFAWYLMQKWLEGFVYRIDITWDVFLFAGLIALFIAVATISYQSIRASQADPAKGLRTE